MSTLTRLAEPVCPGRVAAACAARTALGPTSLVMFAVSALYFETVTGDGFREPGFWQGQVAMAIEPGRWGAAPRGTGR